MKRIMMRVAYLGTAYCGWQVQPNGLSIEQVLNENLSELLGEDIKVVGASRTDAGVHALGNVAVFDTNARMPGDKIAFAMNQCLPEDIVIRGSREVSPDFHPRRTLSVKTYEYRILNATFNNPLRSPFTCFNYMKLDTDLMKEGAKYLVGEHDFTSFCAPRSQAETFVRNVHSIDIERSGEEISILIKGNGFLYNMVRIIAGTLMEVGRGAMVPEEVKAILEAMDRTKAGPTAPAQGLTLLGIEYEE
ncbi:MAG: tRNA pseudouridine(38-40) synthase TruA [Lachnospiraceae bacterium]|nr:tRNA pseudouridine(38-40) synthase TruA [Lachnospiraceae bacterium]